MTRSNKTKAQAAKNETTTKSTDSILPQDNKKQENEKQNSGAKKSLWSDDPEYVSGFVETRKRVARTTPETLMKRVGHKPNNGGSSNVMNSKRTTDANPRRDVKEEIERREIAETKDCLNIQDADEIEASS